MVDVYVIGGGLPELSAALELAEVGLSVRTGDWPIEGAPAAVARARAEAVGGADALPDPDGVLRELLQHIAAPLSQGGHVNDEVRAVSVAPNPVLLRGIKQEWVPQPVPAALGIPAVPISSQAVAVLGGRAAARAYLDRVKPVLTIGKAHSLGELVRSRLGEAVVERLVDPFVRERFGLAADEVEVAAAVPGLNEALTRAGSLSGAVLANADRDVARETAVAPVAGWPAAFAELKQRLGLYGAQVAAATVTAVERTGDDVWRVEEVDGTVTEARALVVGVDASSAREATAVLETAGVLSEALHDVLPTRWRMEARVALAAGADRLPLGDEPALCAVELAEGQHWAVRVEPGGARRARLSGPVIEGVDLEGVPSEGQVQRSVSEALTAVGLAAAGGVEAVLRIAPYASIEQREAAERRLGAAREATHDLLAVGEALHGGSTASAVADARTQAVLLRRRLAGIAD
ncbi:hypothetical protein H490_0108005 [Leucobacter sp. UCD-THU]|uniref:hypothetical protein n=1 Tax=Leucobacter sp. UCD-THU TaxID=1292023 RepID=UPI00037C70FA|nr:hypothetical protein [Leucobacter sp. UCD-THU]EYT54927.1 hypothetical protein H490_0108005 [Leucobacter sp. UCD-THU]